jgi:hypothetical protein
MKELMTIALIFSALLLTTSEALAKLTALRAVRNDSSTLVYVRSTEAGYGYLVPAKSGPWAVNNIWFPSGRSHAIRIEIPTAHLKYLMWQEGDVIRCTPPELGVPCPGHSAGPGDRMLTILSDSSIRLDRFGGLRKLPRAKRVR